MGLNLPPVQRPALQHKRKKDEPKDVDVLLEQELKQQGLIPSFTSVKTAIMRGRVAGLSKEDLLLLAQHGVFGTTSKDWGKIREAYALSAQDPEKTARILRAGISLVEARELESRNELTNEALDLLARLRARS